MCRIFWMFGFCRPLCRVEMQRVGGEGSRWEALPGMKPLHTFPGMHHRPRPGSALCVWGLFLQSPGSSSSLEHAFTLFTSSKSSQVSSQQEAHSESLASEGRCGHMDIQQAQDRKELYLRVSSCRLQNIDHSDLSNKNFKKKIMSGDIKFRVMAVPS